LYKNWDKELDGNGYTIQAVAVNMVQLGTPVVVEFVLDKNYSPFGDNCKKSGKENIVKHANDKRNVFSETLPSRNTLYVLTPRRRDEMKETIRAVFAETINSQWPARCYSCNRTVGYKCITRRGKREWVRYFCHTHMVRWALRANTPIQNLQFFKSYNKPIVLYKEESRWMRVT
jgi:hypothetical protein